MRGIIVAVMLSACAGETVPDDEGVPFWRCECWRSVLVTHGAQDTEVIIPQDQLPSGLMCSTTDPVEAVADALCWERSELCGCVGCEPKGTTCTAAPQGGW